MAFRWWADDGPLLVLYETSAIPSTKKSYQIWTPSDKTFWICACLTWSHVFLENCQVLIPKWLFHKINVKICFGIQSPWAAPMGPKCHKILCMCHCNGYVRRSTYIQMVHMSFMVMSNAGSNDLMRNPNCSGLYSAILCSSQLRFGAVSWRTGSLHKK